MYRNILVHNGLIEVNEMRITTKHGRLYAVISNTVHSLERILMAVSMHSFS